MEVLLWVLLEHIHSCKFNRARRGIRKITTTTYCLHAINYQYCNSSTTTPSKFMIIFFPIPFPAD